MFTNFDKALVAPAVGVVLAILAMLGVKVDVPADQLVTAIVAVVGVLTYFVPNKK